MEDIDREFKIAGEENCKLLLLFLGTTVISLECFY